MKPSKNEHLPHKKHLPHKNETLSTLMKPSKQIYYTKYLENNWKNIKNTWLRIRTIIRSITSIKNIINSVPHSIQFNNRTINDPTAMSNVFNNHFTSIAQKINSNIKCLPKYYTVPFTYLWLKKIKNLLYLL